MFKIKIANLIIGIDNQYEYTSRLCEHYKVDSEQEDFHVSVTEQEIIDEQERGEIPFALPYCESIALYRAICRKLVDYDAFLMHSAALELDGKAYVFAAKSGVGKTTHIKLWMQEFAERVRIINGDKPIYRFLDGKLYACGTPWCGKENLGNNIMTPVKAVCFLEQSVDNHIRSLEAQEVIGRIFHQLLMPKEEEEMNHFLRMIDKMIGEVDFYLLQCNINPKAAVLAYQKMR